MATQTSEERGNSNHAEPTADIEAVPVRNESGSSEPKGVPGQRDLQNGLKSSHLLQDELRYKELLRAAIKSDWDFAIRFFKQDVASKTAKITNRSETVLHIAAWGSQDQFVEKLVGLLSPYPEVLEMTACDGQTALHIAVRCGRIRMVKALVRRNPKLTQLPDNEGRIPLDISAWDVSVHKDIAWFLTVKTTDEGPSHPFSDPYAFFPIFGLIVAGHLAPTINKIHKTKLRHAMALKLAKRAIAAISNMTTAEFAKCFQKWDLLDRTVSWGILEVVELLIEFFPEFIWLSPYGRRLRITAVEYRQENILRLFLKGKSTKLLFVPAPTWEESKMMMMAAAEYKPHLEDVSRVSGAAYELQRELQWFKAVEMSVMPDVRIAKHKGRTYWEIFVKEHDKLRENGEKWVKDTSDKCMLVSTLIATVLFAAAFTVPGGNNNDTGVPLLIGEDSLLVFAISDAFGLFISVMAIMFFVAISTSRYEWEDFLHLLPKRIIMGLSFLSLSLVFMLMAFAATLTIVLDKRLEWIFIPITVLASMTIFSFLGLHLPLLFQMAKSTYGHGIFHPMGIGN